MGLQFPEKNPPTSFLTSKPHCHRKLNARPRPCPFIDNYYREDEDQDPYREYRSSIHSYRPFFTILQQPPSILMALILTNPSAILLRADATIRENVGLDILSRLAASTCFNPSRSASLTASNSSSVRQMLFILSKGLHAGLKHHSPDRQLTHLVFLGHST